MTSDVIFLYISILNIPEIKNAQNFCLSDGNCFMFTPQLKIMKINISSTFGKKCDMMTSFYTGCTNGGGVVPQLQVAHVGACAALFSKKKFLKCCSIDLFHISKRSFSTA